MVLFPNAKINLGLHITDKRPDGFHNIETCFFPIGISDVLEFVVSDSDKAITYSGIAIPGNPLENLCIKAWKLLNEKYSLPAVSIHLHKCIPIGAGLGGGSSDAAFMLKGLNNYFKLGLETGELEHYASQLGSDCAFFIRNTASYATGRGEVLTPINLSLNGYKFVLVKPETHISTPEAYSMVKPKVPDISLAESLHLPVEKWMGTIKNDFEEGLFGKYPQIAAIKESLLASGAVYAAMSGSGSSVFGIFKNNIPENLRAKFKGLYYWQENQE
ncbi:MAG: 4-(cytidine 5'-diphospho)-2-C-methyl-D-erythritol kinase [Bacteroidales bacterium]|nr:4-(cytidine 5'-diphospho)-2-C-methyl-D-erythritol kinase [Bacteroidales bacterium]